MRKIEKLLLIASSLTVIGIADAATTTINVAGNIPGSCQLVSNNLNVDLGDFTNGANRTFNLTLSCNKGAVVSLTAQSANAFALANGSTTVPYTVGISGLPGAASTFSSAADTNAQPLFSNLTSPSNTPLTFPATVTVASQVGNNLPSGSYADTITFTLSYS
mgnify:CR=1 FL=1